MAVRPFYLKRPFWRITLAVFFVTAGVMHLLRPEPYLAIMPPYIPYPELMVDLSGIAEILGGLGVLFPALRRAAGIGLIALLIAVFPANIHMAMANPEVPGLPHAPAWLLWARLPLQLLLIRWVWISTLSRGSGGAGDSAGRGRPLRSAPPI